MPARLLPFVFVLLVGVSANALAVDILVMGLFRDQAIVKIDGKQRALDRRVRTQNRHHHAQRLSK